MLFRSGATGAAPKERAAADGARGQGRRLRKEQRPMGPGERGGGDRKNSCRWGGATGAAPKERAAADGAGREGQRGQKEQRPMGRGERCGA